MHDLEQSRRRILVVDDNRAIHQDFRKILGGDEDAGGLADLEASLFGKGDDVRRTPRYHIDDAYQGQEALAKVIEARQAGDPYVLAFVDMRMPPGWDGAETIERIWAEDAEIQIVLATAYSDYSWDELFSRYGGRDNLLILKKPFDNAEVQQLAAALTEKHRLAQQARLRTEELEAMVEARTAQLREKEEQLRHRQKLEAIGSLAGGVAHEFNNLLQAIQGYTRFAMDELPPDGEPYQDLNQVMEAAQRAAVITGQLLGFSRRQSPEPTTVELTDLAAEAVEMLRPLLDAGIELRLSARSEPASVRADSGMLQQILMNLVTNARDAMPSGGQIEIATAVVTLPDRRGVKTPTPNLKPGPYALLTVRDDGCGMTEEVRERIFDPFYTTKEVGKGTGLGLATVHGLVQQHDGEILVKSSPGSGTTFEIYFPLEQARKKASPKRVVNKSVGGSETILIADDDEIVRNVAVHILRKAGYTPLPVADGESAMQLLAERGDEISLAVLDVVMPRVSGHDVYRHIRLTCPHVKAIFCTGYDPDAEQVRFIKEESKVRLVEKPYPAEVLLRTVRELLDDQPALSAPVFKASRSQEACFACES